MTNTGRDRCQNEPSAHAFVVMIRTGWNGFCLAALILVFGSAQGWSADLIPHPELGVRLARGFQISLYSDQPLADDIQAMTLDALGRVVVSGPGYIRTLVDTNQDGTADLFIPFGHTKSGAMGLCFDGPFLYSVGDDGLWKWTDADWNGIADGAPVRLANFRVGEHGAHALRHSPDGSWMLMAGNDADVHAGVITDLRSPIRSPEAGTLLRFPSDFSSLAVIAHGFRNAYDFDFNQVGDMFTYDSDVEREFLLPWYVPTRLYHVQFAGNHGWRLPGFQRSYAQPDHYPGVVPRLHTMGRASPTGVAIYRHVQFPPFYQNGLFALDWTFGRISFTALEPQASSYHSESSVFLEPMGTAGFAPTDIAVAVDGSVLVSVGGRKTRGAVYRISSQDVDRRQMASNWIQQASTEVDLVLRMPQPLDAWSRAIWRPRASRLGARPFDLAVLAEGLPDSQRVRAIEILTELHGGLMTVTAQVATNSRSPVVRGRLAWSLGRIPCKDFAPILLTLSKDPNPWVRRSALEAVLEQLESIPPATVAQVALANVDQSDKRLRQLAARLAQSLPLANWQAFYLSLMRGGAQSQLSAALAVSMRFATNTFNIPLLTTTLNALKVCRSPAEQLQGLSLLSQAMGDWRILNPTLELYSAYEPQHPPLVGSPQERQILEVVRPMLKSADPLLVSEAARVLGMLRDPDPSLPARLLDGIKPQSDPTTDFHSLIVLSRLPPHTSSNLTQRSAAALVAVSQKVHGLSDRPKQTWSDRFKELVGQLVRRDGGLAEALLRYPGFVTTANVIMVDAFDFPDRERAARLLFAAAKANPRFGWSVPLVRLFGLLPARETRALLSEQWRNPELRDALVPVLAREPDIQDREKFLEGLSSLSTETVQGSLEALGKLPAVPVASALERCLRILERAMRDPQQASLIAPTIRLVNRLTSQSFKIPDIGADGVLLRQSVQPLFDWCLAQYPGAVAGLQRQKLTAASWSELLRTVLWDRGDSTLGEITFRSRACANCHGGGSQVGPDLAGITKRMSPQDLFDHIKFPNKEVAEPYRVTTVQTKQGASYAGIVVFFSADGLLLRLADGDTVRLAESEIASRRSSVESVMPEGLLDGLAAPDLAHLYAYLKSLER